MRCCFGFSDQRQIVVWNSSSFGSRASRIFCFIRPNRRNRKDKTDLMVCQKRVSETLCENGIDNMMSYEREIIYSIIHGGFRGKIRVSPVRIVKKSAETCRGRVEIMTPCTGMKTEFESGNANIVCGAYLSAPCNWLPPAYA